MTVRMKNIAEDGDAGVCAPNQPTSDECYDQEYAIDQLRR